MKHKIIIAIVALIVLAVGSAYAATSMTRQGSRGQGYSPFWKIQTIDGATGNVSAGTTVDIMGFQTCTVTVEEGSTTVFTVQASYDGCSTYVVLDTFTATTTTPYRDLWADCLQINSVYTAGSGDNAYIRCR